MVDQNEVIDKLKKWNNLDESSDEIVETLVDNVCNTVSAYLNIEVKKIPSSLETAVFEVAQTKWVKRGKEGTSSMSEEGYSLSFTKNDLVEWLWLLDKYRENQDDFLIKGRAQSWS